MPGISSGIKITDVCVSNFWSFKNIEVILDDLTILIGANNVGKTSFLGALYAAIGAGRKLLVLGNPQQNAYIERYNRTVRYDWLAHCLFDTIEEVQNFATEWLWTYNNERPNTAIGGIPPKHKLAMVV